MKYVLYKFPRVLKWNQNEEQMCLPKKVKFPVEPELIAVEYGADIYAVTDNLIRAIVDDLTNTDEFKGYGVTADVPDHPDVLSVYTDMEFTYAMQGIAMPVYGEENLLVDFGIIEKDEI